MTPPPAIACFDFDGTLTRQDTMLVFSRFVHSGHGWLWRMLLLSPTLAGYALGLLSGDMAKQRFLRRMFGGMTETALLASGEAFAQQQLPALLRPDMLQHLRWHQQQGHWVLLVTASLSFWTAAFARAHGLVLVSSAGEIRGGVFTGNLTGNNCNGPEKVRRILAVWEAHFPGQPIPTSYAYGDSKGDADMLAWADQGIWRS